MEAPVTTTAFKDDFGQKTLSTGELIVLPKVNLKCILRVTKSIQELVDILKEKLPANTLHNLTTPNASGNLQIEPTQFLSVIPTVMPLVIDQLIDLTASYVNKDREWAENLNLDDLALILTPFFTSFLSQSATFLEIFGMRLNPVPLVENAAPPSARSSDENGVVTTGEMSTAA